MGRISMFLRYRSCVLLYKSAYYKVITYLQDACNLAVFNKKVMLFPFIFIS